ncbi:MAG: hypothetical protein NC094_09705 [Bacteroidales bacterium]|nr:hypothetical protein [Lachnoclostridium sp.]MCM1384122.1 hypothetical protein [Lachnoclostridium sp.]MCM1465682.1 hypothetical protein [Bacteroidales bacterium]
MKKIRKNEFFGVIFVICMMIFYSMYQWKEFRDNCMYLGLITGLIQIIISVKMQLKTFFLYIVFSVIPIIAFMQSQDTRILVMLMAMLCGITLDREHIINVMFYTKLICVIIGLVSGGFNNVNGLALQGGILIMLYICKYDTISMFRFLLVSMLYIAIALYTHTGAFIVCMGIGIIWTFLHMRKHQLHFLVNSKMAFVYPICLFLNYFFAAGIGEQTMPFIGQWLPDFINSIYLNTAAWLDKITSSRMTLTKYSWVKFGVSLWGGNVDYSQLQLGGSGYFNLDSGFMWLIQGGGILLTIAYMVFTVLLMRYLIKNKYYHYIIAGIVIALWSINEDVLLGFGTNYLTIFMGKAVIDFITERKKSKSEYTEKDSLLLVRK